MSNSHHLHNELFNKMALMYGTDTKTYSGMAPDRIEEDVVQNNSIRIYFCINAHPYRTRLLHSVLGHFQTN